METQTPPTVETMVLKKSDYNRIIKMLDKAIELEAENKRLQSLLVPSDVDLEKYNALDISDIDLSLLNKPMNRA